MTYRLRTSPPGLKTAPRIATGSAASLLLVALAACGPGTAVDSATDSASGGTETSTSGETSDGSTSDGEVPLECEGPPIAVDPPLWVANLDALGGVIARPDGALVHAGEAVIQRGGDGVTWSLAIEPGESARDLAPLADGRIIVAGDVNQSGGDEASLWLALVSADGERLDDRTFDLAPGVHETSLAVATDGTGSIVTLSLVGAALRLDRFDGSLEHQGSVDLGTYAFPPALAVDEAGDAYVATAALLGSGSDPLVYTWRLDVRAYGVDGALRWASEGITIEAANEIPDVDVAVGDQVYAVLGNRSGFAFQAFDPASGALAWTKTRASDSDVSEPELADHWFHSVAASPCGGVFVGGRVDVPIDFISERASVLHVSAEGALGPVTYVLDEPEGSFYAEETTELAVSPGGWLVGGGDLHATSPEALDARWVGALGRVKAE